MKDFQNEDPENWKWGIFYFNKKDFRYVVPKKNQMLGWTFNFAHPTVHIASFLILALTILLSIITR